MDALNSKLDLLLEAINGGRVGVKNGFVLDLEEMLNVENTRLSRGMQFRSIKLDFSWFDGENPIG